jgi:hypothetical protein
MPSKNTELYFFTDEPYRMIGMKTECEYFWNTKEETNDSNGDKGNDIGGVEEKEQTT